MRTLLLLATLLGAEAYVGRVPVPQRRRCRGAILQEEGKTKSPFPLPFFQQNVPEDQQPTFELRNLKKQAFQDWPTTDGYNGKLFTLYQGITLFLSLPIAYTTFYVIPDELPQLFISSNFGTFAVMIAFIARLRLSWGFVSKRLKSRTAYFEADQTGKTVIKDKGMLLRDRLLETNEVAPALKRIDVSLLTVIAALMFTYVGGEALTVSLGDAGPYTLKTIYGEEATRFDNRLKGDDDFAREEQRRMQSRGDSDGGLQPGYCNSRYYKILAGGNGQGGVGCQ